MTVSAFDMAVKRQQKSDMVKSLEFYHIANIQAFNIILDAFERSIFLLVEEEVFLSRIIWPQLFD